MTLSKQLILLMSTIFVVIFLGNFLISVNNVRSYLEVESEQHAQDTATALGLSLSQDIADINDPMIETKMSIVFDRGYFKEVKLTDPQGTTILRMRNDEVFHTIPKWFQSAFPIKTATADSKVSSGWGTGGILYITTNPGYGYLKLYDQAIGMLQYSLIAFLITFFILLVMIKYMLQPLKMIERLAGKIAEGQFETIEKLPWTTEIKNVAQAMNLMSRKIEGIINKLNNNLEKMNDELHSDDLTKLPMKSTFETDMKKIFIEKGSAYVYLVKIDDLGVLAKEKGNEVVDGFLKEFAEILGSKPDGFDNKEITAYRFFGSEFAVIAKLISFDQASEIATHMKKGFVALGKKYGKLDVAHIGATPFNLIGTTPQILASAEEAYEKAKLIGPNSFSLRNDTDLAKDMSQWRDLVFDIVDSAKFDVSYIGPIINCSDEQLILEEAFTQAFDTNGEVIPIGTFVSIAEKYDKIIDLDKNVTLKVIDHIKKNSVKHGVSINISFDSLKSLEFKNWLFNTIKKDASIASKLVFSVTAYAAAKDIDQFKAFIEFVHRFNARVILKRFEAQFISFETVQDLRLDYLRLARDYTNGISKDAQKRAFVESMYDLSQLIDLKVFAENVKEDADFDTVKTIGIVGASR
jgi:EAL domain-containing protein (putative c-di-GMP-specific phosphodiesterase class I)/GGDEF domain-containing protein